MALHGNVIVHDTVVLRRSIDTTMSWHCRIRCMLMHGVALCVTRAPGRRAGMVLMKYTGMAAWCALSLKDLIFNIITCGHS